MKKILTKMIIIMLMVLLFTSICINSFGTDPTDITAFENVDSSRTEEAENWIRKGSSTIIISLRIACTVIAVVILLVISIKYMTSAPGERADIKKHAIPYAVGVVILFGASGILAIIEKLSVAIKAE